LNPVWETGSWRPRGQKCPKIAQLFLDRNAQDFAWLVFDGVKDPTDDQILEIRAAISMKMMDEGYLYTRSLHWLARFGFNPEIEEMIVISKIDEDSEHE
jgi:hypothetical protein